MTRNNDPVPLGAVMAGKPPLTPNTWSAAVANYPAEGEYGD